MPIPLNKHVKIWVNSRGIIPDKIVNRLLFQRKIRPNDELTLFVNEQCLKNSKDKMITLNEHGIKIEIIEKKLTSKSTNSDSYLIELAKNILTKAKNSSDVKDAVFFSDIFRMTEEVLKRGLYSDTDVIFLNNNTEPYIESIHYLYGNHNSLFFTDLVFDTAEDLYDIHIFGVDSFKRPDFHEKLVKELQKFYGAIAPSPDDSRLEPFPGMTFVHPILEQKNHGHLDFAATRANIISGKDDSHIGGEDKLYASDENDDLLNYAKSQMNNSTFGHDKF